MKYNLIIAFLLFTYSLSAQEEYILQGKVTTEHQDSIFGEAILYQFESDIPIKFTLIEEGKFIFDPIPAEKYSLKINCLGYKMYEQTLSLTKHQKLDVVLQTSEEELEGVVVTARKKIIENSNGNLSLNVAQTELASLATPTDILSRMPGLIVSPDQNSVSVITKGNLLIYVGNQRISFQEFSAMPVESIKSIELINNPSAKYEADGRAVLMIERTANYIDGYQLSARNVTSKRRAWNNWASSNFNFKKGKLESRINFGFNKLRPFEGHTAENNILLPNYRTSIDGETLPYRTQYIYGGGLFYKINDQDYISLYVNGRDHADDGIIYSTTTSDISGTSDTLVTEVPEIGERGLRAANINYNKALKAIQGNLFIGGQVSNNFRNNDGNINVVSLTTAETYKEKRDQYFSVNSAALRIDFEKQMNNLAKWETGINISNTKADSFSEFIFFDQTPSSKNAYTYREANFAAYTQYSNQTKPLKYTLGIRTEKNLAQGKFEDEDELLIDRDQLNFFPRLNLNYQLDSTSTLSFDYTRSIQRPHFLNATTISTFIGPVNEYMRNINLLPALNDELSITYQFGQQSIAFQYSFSKNPTLVLSIFDEMQQRILSSPENWDNTSTFRLVYICPLQKKKWRSTFYIMPTWSITRESRAVATDSRPYMYFYNSTNLQVSKKVNLGARLWGLSKRNDGVYESEAFYVLSASVQYKISKQFSLTLNANDILKQWKIVTEGIVNNILNNETRFTDQHEFSITLNYQFGKHFKSNYQNKNVDENLKRI